MKRGTTGTDYIKAWLRRDHPEIAEELEQGQHRSARAAGIAAGFIKDVPTVRLQPDPSQAAAAIVKRVGIEFAAQLAIELAELTKQASVDLVFSSKDIEEKMEAFGAAVDSLTKT